MEYASNMGMEPQGALEDIEKMIAELHVALVSHWLLLIE